LCKELRTECTNNENKKKADRFFIHEEVFFKICFIHRTALLHI
jgi:hypothetical protein